MSKPSAGIMAADGEGGESGGGANPIALRKDFNPLAAFVPATPTDANRPPTAIAPIDGRETSVGRYLFDIPGLAAGTWDATIAMGGEGTVRYGFEVQR